MSNKSITLKSLKAEVDTLGRLHSDLAEQVMELVKAAVAEANSHPQRVEVEPWDPKEGDLVVTLKYAANGSGQIGAVMPIQQVDDGPWRYRVHPEEADDINRWYSLDWIRPATSEEITLYKHEEAARLKKEKEEAKPLEFGTRVTTGVHGTVYRIACFEPDSGGQWRLTCENAGPHSSFLAKRSEFTIKEP